MGSSQTAASFLQKIARAAFGVGAAGIALNSSLYTVASSERAVIFDRFQGIRDETIGEGSHCLIPFLQKPLIFDIRSRPHTLYSAPQTKDLKRVNLTLRVFSHPDGSRLPVIAQNHGLDYKEKVLSSIGDEIMKSTVAQFNADQLITERPQFSSLVRESFVQRAKDFNIAIDQVVIVHTFFGSEYLSPKRKAQTEAKKSKYDQLMKEEEERVAIIIAEAYKTVATIRAEAKRERDEAYKAAAILRAKAYKTAANIRAEGKRERDEAYKAAATLRAKAYKTAAALRDEANRERDMAYKAAATLRAEVNRVKQKDR